MTLSIVKISDDTELKTTILLINLQQGDTERHRIRCRGGEHSAAVAHNHDALVAIAPICCK